MILGQVNHRNEAIIPVAVRNAAGQTRPIDATIDTGFSGHLTLPAAVIAALQLTYDRTDFFTLGDNNDVSFELFRGVVAWDGHDRRVWVLSSESEPLVGMELLHGYQLFVDVVDGGEVRIHARP